ncbi:MAG: ATPase, T2SS/T4P/T4SS family [Thermoproteota archaeon]
MGSANPGEKKEGNPAVAEARVEAKPAVVEKKEEKPKPVKEEKKKKKKEEEEEEVVEYVFEPVPVNAKPVDEYWIEEPFVRILIVPIPGRGGEKGYFIDEVSLDKTERNAFNRLKDILSRELKPPEDMSVEARSYVMEEARRLMKKYRSILGSLNEESMRKVEYYIRRDLIGYGPINPIVEDKNVEDISCDGIDKPVYVWHRRYESLPSNLRIADKGYFNDFIIKLAHFAGKHISAAFPIVDAMLPGRHRLAATYGDEVSTFGSTFTIRKFREEPFSIVDLIKLGTISPSLAAYFWFILDNRLTVMVIGGTGAGKTSFLNALTNLFKPGLKIVTVEETAELNIPHDNWVQFVTRESYGLGTSKIGEITMFDLVKTSLRYRPDYLIVGEIRGAEAFVLFQAMASVSRDTPVLVKDGEGRVSLVRVGDFVDGFYEEGEERILKHVEGYWVLSHAGFKPVWKPVRYVLRHSTGEVYEVEYESGGRLLTTGSHSVFILDPETLDVKEEPVERLKPGDYLVTFTGGGGDDYCVINTVEMLSGLKDVYADNLPAGLKRLTGGRNPVLLSVLTRLSAEEEELEGAVLHCPHGHALPALARLDENLAFVFGAYVAEGCVKRGRGKRLCFTFGKGEADMANRVVEILAERFGVKPSVDDRGTYLVCEFNHTLLAELFEKLFGACLREKRIPSQLWSSPSSVVRAFFEGLRADARRTVRKRGTQYSTANEWLAYQLAWLARLAGFYSSLRCERGTGKNSGKTYWNVIVYLNHKYRKPNPAERIPVKPFLKLIGVARPTSMPFRLTYIRKREFVTKRKALEILEWIRAKGHLGPEALKYLRMLEKLIQGQLAVVKVRNIRRRSYKGYVYDLSVPETESFLGGGVPVLLHNTGHGGLSTVHAENIDYAIKRMTSPPMNIAESYIPLMNVACLVERVVLPKKAGVPFGRRVRHVWELDPEGNRITISHWDPMEDVHEVDFRRSVHLPNVCRKIGMPPDWYVRELQVRESVIRWMMDNNVTHFRDVARVVTEFHVKRAEVLSRLR